MARWGRSAIWAGLALAAVGCDDAADESNVELDMTYQLRDAAVLNIDQGRIEPDPVGGQGGGAGGTGGGEAGQGGVGGGAGGSGGGIVPGDCSDGAQRPCASGCGTETCANGAWSACEPGVETCNGADDDCDDRVDESWPDLGNGCSVDQGACTARGTLVCNAAGNDMACEADDVVAEAEQCNGLDDDCDELVDEDFPGQACCSENFHCPPGESCQGGTCTGEGPGPGPGPGPNPGGPGSCASPTAMPGFGQYPGDTSRGENAGGGSCAGLLGNEVVYSFTLGETRRVQLDTLGSFNDTSIYVRTDCANGFSEVACNEDGPNGGAAAVLTFEAQANVQYFVFVDSFLLGGPFTLNFGPEAVGPQPECANNADCGVGEVCNRGSCEAGPQPECVNNADCAANEECSGGRCVAIIDPECEVDADCFAGEVCVGGECERPLVGGACEAAVDMNATGRYMADTDGRANEHSTSCQARATGGEAVFTFQVDANSRVVLNTDDSDFDTVLSVRTDCAAEASELQCNDDGGFGTRSEITFDAQAGVRYYALVDGYNSASGAVVLDYSAEALPERCPCAGGRACVNDLCYDPFPAACGNAFPGEGFGQYVGNTSVGMNQHTPSCSLGSDAPESILAFGVEAPRRISINTEGSSFDTVLYVMSDCGNEIACDDDGGALLTSALAFDAVPGQIYYIVVDGYRQTSGEFTLNVR